ncbi:MULTISPECIES: acyl carrier protein [Flavobacterium]|jgi:acyl carrier protein|uniref:Acyl carrier protein n=1 Tax=Flavobacterium tructae TaxID=1114873 RepID=A0A1S1JDU9_9FLAO|nr:MULTISPECIES: phosphopantetheine-binding protein [Flavobacterium]MDL2141002.1 phosphopantetheine-binding protein [Flavobacterium tructae]OHT46433.1 acyl carrier protein [Flavobacterium tructae]OXB22395.1 acyl carrier protein [Flavobacterium tructae]OXB24101.1 acyl carrier protein [Flavobacterium tructae]URC13767.1 phosphopantetheine-binding protein [Flavobacterium sp. B183]
MNKEEIIARINGFLVDEFEVDNDDIEPDANLKNTLGLDSLDYVDLVVSIESNFGVKLVEADFVGIATFQNFYDLIETKLKAKAV